MPTDSVPTTSSPTSASPISAAFRSRSERGQAALVPYVTAGYRTRDESLELLIAAADEGADILELGIPFSDPLADGPTIQRATFEALEGGMTVRGAFELLREFRAARDTPVVLFSYLNPVYRFGVDAFVAEARGAGASGLLLTDLPAGAEPAIEQSVRDGGLDLIRLLAPTTPPARIPKVLEGASGFLYYISRTGVTGARTELRGELAEEIRSLRETAQLPVAVGFGISTPAQAALVADVADGVVVGSALMEAVGRGGVEEAAGFVRALREAMDAPRG